jgi:hypothetical protein
MNKNLTLTILLSLFSIAVPVLATPGTLYKEEPK